EGMKETLDVRKHVQQNPLGMVGGAAALGFLAGLIVFRSRPAAGAAPAFTPMPVAGYAAAPSRPAWLNDLIEMGMREVKKIAEQALTTTSASLKHTVE